MTVGTGVGDSEAKVNSLSHGLLQSIKHHRPEKIVFFGSTLSQRTLESMEAQSIEILGEEMPEYEFVLISNVDEFNECFTPLKEKIKEYDNYEVLIDYTSGTKTMTMSAAICSVLYHKELVMVAGSRGPNGLVKSLTEIPKPQNLYQAYDEILFNDFKVYFNSMRFESAGDTLDKIVDLENKEGYLNLTRGYQAWDLFDHKKARELLTSKEVQELGLGSLLKDNLSILGMLGDPHQKDKSDLMVADLLNNARRRGDENKFDDAVARLYRCVELIAQCTLEEKGILTSNVDESKLSPLTLSNMVLKKGRDGKIKLGLHESYTLLRYEGHDLGIYFENSKKLKNLLKKRNDSILAHGLVPIKKEDYESLLEKTISLGEKAYPRLAGIMEKAEFPQLR